MNALEPTISVIIPTYNQADYLAAALHSVLAQTYRDYEIVIVDDGSTDETPHVVRSFVAVRPRQISYMRQANRGLAVARNAGIRAAKGHWVALLDSDDIWLPDFLETMLQILQDGPETDVGYCGVQFMDAHGVDLPQVSHQTVPPHHLYAALLRANFLIPSTIVLRRMAVLGAGYFDPAFRRLQDWELWWRMLQLGYNFVGTEEILVRYRVHDASLSADALGGQRAMLDMVEKHFGHAEERAPDWPWDKVRAYGGAFRYHALNALQRQHDWVACASYLRKAFQFDPSLAHDLSLFYELALGAQPLGYRGSMHYLDLEENAAEIEQLLYRLFREPCPAAVKLLHAQVHSTAYFALGTVAYHTEQYALSRRFLPDAIRIQPELMRNRMLTGMWLKSLIGPSGLNWLRQLRGSYR
ncbi:MAG: glycosyltransferase family A protein [Caldilineaceae bacterium]